ncbi:MAG TPA: 2-dehydropantoate 2-reductase [Steroidobacteraceae bacterium]|nr:2-dehydropantoate 2-reductase [Steroidobacteraceae bacterium]
MRFAMLGAGALGTILGAHLIRAGHEVTMIARGARAKWIAQNGLAIHGLANINTRCNVVEAGASLPQVDCFIVATKAIDTEVSLRPFAGLKVETVFSMQNGVLKDSLIADAFGSAAVLGSMADFSGELLASGDVIFTRNAGLDIGELNGSMSSRASELAKLINESGVRCTAVPDIQTREWSKFAAWVALGPIAALTRLNTWQYLTDERGARLAVDLVREACKLADAVKVPLMDLSPLPALKLRNSSDADAREVVKQIGRKFESDSPTHRMSVLQDIDRGGPLEIKELLGYALDQAEKLNVPMPVLRTSYDLLSIGRSK